MPAMIKAIGAKAGFVHLFGHIIIPPLVLAQAVHDYAHRPAALADLFVQKQRCSVKGFDHFFRHCLLLRFIPPFRQLRFQHTAFRAKYQSEESTKKQAFSCNILPVRRQMHSRRGGRAARSRAPPGQGCQSPVPFGGAPRQSLRSAPQKNSATVPGPVWLPMVVPMLLISTLPSSFGNFASTRSATARASS